MTHFILKLLCSLFGLETMVPMRYGGAGEITSNHKMLIQLVINVIIQKSCETIAWRTAIYFWPDNYKLNSMTIQRERVLIPSI